MDDGFAFEETIHKTIGNFSFTNKLGIQSNEVLDSINAQLLESKSQIELLRTDFENQIAYSEMSKIGSYGYRIYGKREVKFQTHLAYLLAEIINTNSDKYQPKPTIEAGRKIDIIIEEYPSFPFAYVLKGTYLRMKNDSDWKTYDMKALEILDITTKFKKAHPHHFHFKKQIEAKLKE